VTFARLRDRSIAFEDTGGDGTPVVFLHAATGSAAMWEGQLAAFAAAGHRSVAFDRVGSGQSTLDSDADPGSAADDLQALVEHLGLGRFHLVGTAAGGIVALDYAATFQHHLRSLVVANSIGGVQDDEYLAMQARLRPAPAFDALPPDVRELGPSYRALNEEGTARWLELVRTSRAAHPIVAPQRPRNPVTFGLLESIGVPALLITGDADLYCPPSVLRLFAARIPNSQMIVASECGHSAYWEQPDIFNRMVLEFIAAH